MADWHSFLQRACRVSFQASQFHAADRLGVAPHDEFVLNMPLMEVLRDQMEVSQARKERIIDELKDWSLKGSKRKSIWVPLIQLTCFVYFRDAEGDHRCRKARLGLFSELGNIILGVLVGDMYVCGAMSWSALERFEIRTEAIDSTDVCAEDLINIASCAAPVPYSYNKMSCMQCCPSTTAAAANAFTANAFRPSSPNNYSEVPSPACRNLGERWKRRTRHLRMLRSSTRPASGSGQGGRSPSLRARWMASLKSTLAAEQRDGYAANYQFCKWISDSNTHRQARLIFTDNKECLFTFPSGRELAIFCQMVTLVMIFQQSEVLKITTHH
ncbi:hypothetical protein GNI_063840 [Gregarina niphandrodes]|uniref:Uncharacterized protein n=1 Tax=Gregarina niphandrodes TaxID=110365 RepID=A0A023B835_GRENI|nr:hypothetical protein GNI_063840 [Gregarina niphandrodes]EZG68164.1 hypothetical protein GNI_063840 [Gregarina niphandrodes]|eukprot:XP_011130058.1 hypothetical protein GNI_063840 [Gregarina niphandrodes]